MSSYKIKIRNINETLEADENEKILDAALTAGIKYPFSCRAGRCGACKSRLISGEVDQDSYSRFALSEKERHEGLILACRARPKTDLELRWLGEDSTRTIPEVHFQGTLIEKELLTHDICLLRIMPPAGIDFQFLAGQFSNLKIGNHPVRSYSMANRPGTEILEFHVRRMPNGRVSGYVFDTLRVGDLIDISGPYGDSYLRESHTGPIFAVAGGSGLAPIQSIVTQALEAGMRQPITLYFGVREERDLYYEDKFRIFARLFPNFNFIPVLSQSASSSSYRLGLVGSVLLEEQTDFSDAKIYMAGPLPMVESLTVALTSRGLSRADIHADAF